MDVKPVVLSTEFSAEDSRIFDLALNSWAVITYPIHRLAEVGIFIDKDTMEMYQAIWDRWQVFVDEGETK